MKNIKSILAITFFVAVTVNLRASEAVRDATSNQLTAKEFEELLIEKHFIKSRIESLSERPTDLYYQIERTDDLSSAA